MADAAMSSDIACVEAGPGDFKIASPILTVCDSFKRGARPFRAQAAPEVNLEGSLEAWSCSTCRKDLGSRRRDDGMAQPRHRHTSCRNRRYP